MGARQGPEARGGSGGKATRSDPPMGLVIRRPVVDPVLDVREVDVVQGRGVTGHPVADRLPTFEPNDEVGVDGIARVSA